MANRKKPNKLPVIVFILLVLFSFVAIAVVNIINFEDYVIADVLQVSGSTVIIGNNCTAIIAETSPERAQAIDDEIRGIMEQRPNTYDIFAETLKSFNISLEYVTLDNFINGTYYSNLYLKSANKVLKLDTKPSDAIALALKTNSTIYLNKALLNEVGEKIC